MKKLVSLILAIALVMGAVSALADVDWSKYTQFPLVTDDSVTIRVATIRSDADGIDAKDMWFWNWLEWVSGVKFDVEQILSSVRNEKLNLLFASGDLPDWLYGMGLSTSEMVRYGQSEGLLMPLNEYINEDVMPNFSAWVKELPRCLAYCTAPDGNVYTLPWLYEVGTLVGESSRVFMNEKWAKDLGYEEVPTTLDDFEAMLYAMKADKPDSIPLGGGMETRNSMFYIMNAYGYLGKADNYGHLITMKDGKPVIPAGDPTFKEVLATMKKYYADGIIAEDYFTMDGTKLSSYMSEGSLGVYPFVPFTVNNDEAFWGDWCSVKPLTSAYNDKQQWLEYDTVSVGNWAISANSQYGELMARLADAYFSDIGVIYAWDGPMNGTADCLDMTEGWIIDPETNSRAWPEIASGKYASTGPYMQQVGCAVTGGGIGNHAYTLGLTDIPAGLLQENVMRWLYGAPIEAERKYNLKEPDPAFRYSMLQNISPYETSGFPNVVYYDEDTTYAMNDLKTVIDTYIKGEVAKFIVGERDLEEFDKFVEELEGIGLREYEGYYQAAYDAYLASME